MKKVLQFVICLIHHFYRPQFTFLYVFITRIFLSFCLFNDAGFILCSDLNTTGKDIWKIFLLLWDNCQHLNLSLPHKGKHPSCEWRRCIYESQRMFLKWIHYKRKPPSFLFLRHFEISHLRSVMTAFFRVLLPPQRLFFFHQLLPLSLLRGMLWSCFSLRLLVFHWAAVKKNSFFFCSMSWTKIEGEGRRRGSK